MQTGPGAALTFLYYFAITVAIVTPLSMRLGGSVVVPFWLNPAIGVIAGGLGAYFNRSTTVELPFSIKQKRLREELDRRLNNLGYSAVDGECPLGADWTMYRRSPLRQLFSGTIYVKLEPQHLILSSRAAQVRQLRAQLQPLLKA